MAQGQIFDGKNVRFKLNGAQTLFHATSCQLTISSETQEYATKDTNGKIVGIDNYSGSLSTDGLWSMKETANDATQVDAAELLALQIAKTLITFEFSSGVSGDTLISGSCYVTNTDLTAEVGNKATVSHQFLVSGDITVGAVV